MARPSVLAMVPLFHRYRGSMHFALTMRRAGAWSACFMLDERCPPAWGCISHVGNHCCRRSCLFPSAVLVLVAELVAFVGKAPAR